MKTEQDNRSKKYENEDNIKEILLVMNIRTKKTKDYRDLIHEKIDNRNIICLGPSSEGKDGRHYDGPLETLKNTKISIGKDEGRTQ